MAGKGEKDNLLSETKAQSDGGNPFGRTSKIKRTPPATPQGRAPLHAVTPMESDNGGAGNEVGSGGVKLSTPPAPFKTPQTPAPGEKRTQRSPWSLSPPLKPSNTMVEVLERQVDDCDLAEEEQIAAVTKAIRQIRDAMGVQKNISKSVRTAIEDIEEAVSVLKGIRVTRLKSLKDERREWRRKAASPPTEPSTKRQKTTPSSEAPKRADVTTMTTPPQKKTNRTGKRKGAPETPRRLEGSIPAQTPEPLVNSPAGAEGGFTEVKSRSAIRREKRKKVAAEKAKATPARGAQTGNKKNNGRRPKGTGPGERRRNVLLIKPGQGRSYADVVGKLRRDVHPEQSGVEVRRLRRTNDGGVLIELGSGRGQAEFAEAVKSALGADDVLKSVAPRLRVEVMDLDSCTTQDEVSGALRRELGDGLGDFKVFLTKPNAREQRIAVVDLVASFGQKLLQKAKLKVGWVICRVRTRVEVPRCFRCLEYGHTRRECKGPDRSEACWKCGGAGHKSSSCDKEPSCEACKKATDGRPSNHAQGSGACRTFRDLLVSRKKSRRTD